MKSFFNNVLIILIFFIMLLFPREVFEGASNGLLLWFQIILPTLFPFLLFSNLLFVTGSLNLISNVLGKPCSRMFHVSEISSFAIVAGFLCGYPMGAKVSADLVNNGYITKNEGEYLLSFCNNISPVFIINFITMKILDRQDLIFPSLVISILAPIVISLFTRKIYRFEYQKRKVDMSVKQWDFKDIDKAILESFEILVKVGGYIILFSVFLVLLQKVHISWKMYPFLLSTLEMTNGLMLLGKMNFSFAIKYPILLGLAVFGGWCLTAQTKCVVQNAGLRIRFYIIEKLAAALTASLLGLVYMFLL